MAERLELHTSDMEMLAQKFNNWGRWGDDDEAGTLNLVTPERVAAAAALVTRGVSFSMAIPFDKDGPQNGLGGRTNPMHVMVSDGGDIATGAFDDNAVVPGLHWTDDYVIMGLQTATQWDALSHVFYKDKMYNGYGLRHVSSSGATKNSIATLKNRFAGRGVLLDMARYHGVDWLDDGYLIDGDELEACAERQGVEVGPGDFVCIRTGALTRVKARGSWGSFAQGEPAPGLALSAANFLCARDVAAIAADNYCVEAIPQETADFWCPLHVVLLVNAGIHMGEMWNLDDLAADCAEDKSYEFMLVAQPLPVTGAVGSPVNPIAFK
ncbi:cyclase family protein [Rhodococcus opacus]|uniref:cyclase family protein n=1 Tax=Rhodococcus opacus TaxID=37919 RepID=UPI001C4683CD|nr:cyclase family protein [Rhodococcus opacus]MBV6759055.1 cyclase family protein [Rhodococcus opacus]